MKKIYFSLASIIMCGALVAQNAPQGHLTAGKLAPTSKVIQTNKMVGTRDAGPFNLWIDPVGDVMSNKGLDITSTTPNQDMFINPIFQDSTVQSSFQSGSSYIGTCFQGNVLDPKSSYLNPNLTPYVSRVDAYTLDSLYIQGSYVKVTPAIDTLYIWLVWGDTSNTSVFTKSLATNVWVQPISDWRRSVIGAKMTGYTAAAGNKVKPSAPLTNQKLIKYVLASTDSADAGYAKYIPVALDVPVVIPAGNIVSCVYTFVPGGTYAAGDCMYNLNGTTTQNINGFAGSVWGQVDPAVTQLSDYVDQQVDPDGWNMGATYYSFQRHGTGGSSSVVFGDLVSTALVLYHITGTSSVGVSEVKHGDLTLNQNYPNPAKGITSINYELVQATDVVIEVKDITGKQVMAVKRGKQTAGKYNLDFDTNQLESGIYFYTLKTETAQITKKMSVIK